MIHLRHNQAPYAVPVADTPRDVVWLQRGTWLCVLVLVCLLLFMMLRSLIFAPWFSIQNILLRGDTQFHNTLTIRANVLPQLSGNYFTADLRHAQKTFEALPWIRSAVVQRVFPDQLKVLLTAHQPAARWETLQNANASPEFERLVNQQGELFDASSGALDTEDLPVLAGPDNRAAEVLETFQTLRHLMQKQNMVLLRLVIDPFNSWQATLDNEATVALGGGSGTEVVTRAQRWLNHWPALKRQYESSMTAVDLRYSQGFSARMLGVTTREKTR